MKRQVGVFITKEWIDKLKQIARQESTEQNKDISYLDLIRIAIQEKYNLEEQ